MTLLVTEQDIREILSIKAAIPVIEEMFRMAGEGSAENMPRVRMPFAKGFLQFGAGALHAKKVMGFKVWANFGSPLRQVFNHLYSMETSELLAIIQAHAIGTCRTSAATAVAVKYLSAPDAAVVGMYGAGIQAEGQLEAICAVRPIRSARVYSRTRKNLEAFCTRMAARLGIEVIAADAPESVPDGADIIVTITKSETPVLFGEWIKRPCLVVGAGANHWYEREIDEKLVSMAKRVVVDDREHAKIEGGDLLWPIDHGMLRWDQVKNLGDVVVGRDKPPRFDAGVILFESHGLAIEDVAISAVAYELARARGLGREIIL